MLSYRKYLESGFQREIPRLSCSESLTYWVGKGLWNLYFHPWRLWGRWCWPSFEKLELKEELLVPILHIRKWWEKKKKMMAQERNMSQDLAELVLKPNFSNFKNLYSLYHATVLPRKGKQKCTLNMIRMQRIGEKSSMDMRNTLLYHGLVSSGSFDLWCLGREDHLYLQGRARPNEASFLVLERPCFPPTYTYSQPIHQSASSNA